MLEKALADTKLVDDAKKALMYGKDRPTIAAFRTEVLSIPERGAILDYPAADVADGMRRLHAALGMRSEADEILQHELGILCGGTVDRESLIDEAGDLAWYAQLYANALDVSWVAILRRNVAKLITRYAGLTFDARAANAPDKAAEAAAQAAA